MLDDICYLPIMMMGLKMLTLVGQEDSIVRYYCGVADDSKSAASLFDISSKF